MKNGRPFLAIIYRSPHLLVAVARNGHLLELRRHRLGSLRSSQKRLRTLMIRQAAAYCTAAVVFEDDDDCARSRVLARAAKKLGLECRWVELADAKRYVLAYDRDTDLSPAEFFDRLVAKHQELRRFVRILPGTGRVARIKEDWRLGLLVVATMALAAVSASVEEITAD